ncbi:MAG TPA: phosphohydrolase [Eubacteriaceae bacterium]|nr:phosphohydrolase [Eubacteriaceae bacterium]
MNRKEMQKQLKSMLSEKRWDHTLGVVETAKELAVHYKINEEKAEIAALCHDCAKEFSKNQLLEYVREYQIPVDEVTLYEPELLHGPVGRVVAKEELGITDEEVLEAIENHTTGDVDMSMLEKIIYLADFIEPTRQYQGVEALRSLAFENLDHALIQSFDNTIAYVISLHSVLHPKTIKARNQLIIKKEKEERI